MEKAIIYLRQSFGSEEESASIEVQRDVCKRYCKSNHIEIVDICEDKNTSSELYPLTESGVIRAKYDDGFQAWLKEQRTPNRKEYKEHLGEAFNRIESEKITYLVAYETDRIYRNATNSNLSNYIISFLIKNKCSIIEAHYNRKIDFSDTMQQVFSNFKAAIEYESLQRKRIASMQSVEFRKNQFRVISNAFGVISRNGKITFDANKAEMIKYIYDAVIRGESYQKILHIINRKYIDLLPKYKRDGKIYRSKQFYHTNIMHILTNIVYTGYAINMAGEIKRAINIQNPIIDYSTYIEVQKIIKNKKRGYQKYNLKENKKRHFLPFSGYLKCQCGRRLTVAFDKGIVYRCVNHDGHIMRLRTNYEYHNQNFYTTLQSLFILNCIKSRLMLDSLQQISRKENELQAKIDSKVAEYRAKLMLVKNADDMELAEPIITRISKEINELREELKNIKYEKNKNYDEIREKIDIDFYNIQNSLKLQECDYQRLLQETIKEIIVSDTEIIVSLTDKNGFTLPRIMIDRRGKKVLPWSSIAVSPKISGEYNDEKFMQKQMYTMISFYCDDTKNENDYCNSDSRILLETDSYCIRLFK